MKARAGARRATSLDAVARRRARDIVAPIQARIGPWQSRLVFLRTAGTVGAAQDVSVESAMLLPLVVAARLELEAAVDALNDEGIARESVIGSVRDSLVRLRDDLESLTVR